MPPSSTYYLVRRGDSRSGTGDFTATFYSGKARGLPQPRGLCQPLSSPEPCQAVSGLPPNHNVAPSPRR